MRIQIVAPAPPGSTRGNRITATRWQTLLHELGHTVALRESFAAELATDCVMLLHARHSHASVLRVSEQQPRIPIMVCLTGTDLHIDFAPQAGSLVSTETKNRFQAVQQSLELADQIVLLEPQGVEKLSPAMRKKCRVILQSAETIPNPKPPPSDCFLVSVLGHLRPVKDPFRTALAARRLPTTSKIRVQHIGDALSNDMKTAAEKEARVNNRYSWLGGISHQQALENLAASHLTILSSQHEGAPSVISEAIVNKIPILASRIDATVGLLGTDYPGFFKVGDTQQLADLMLAAETQPDFLRRLKQAISPLVSKFSPQRERENWQSMLQSLGVTKSGR
ncbi:MAG: selenoneine biosynthesis selenosugar synthase SenB [Pirellulaceae bacterium]|nr:selenoneine biosynthesis selenosugar synthase SenB [Pirellulaceae bacterium]